jgi:hypothetical protein
MKRFPLLPALLALAFAAPAQAYFEQSDAGARVIAMGPAAMASVNDVSAYHWNPAALASLRRTEVLLDYSKPYGVDNLNENSLAFGGRWRNTGLAVAWHRLGVTDAYAEDQFSASAGRTVYENAHGLALDGGASVKFMRAGFQSFEIPGGGRVDFGSTSHPSVDLAARLRTPWSVDFSWVLRDALQPRFEFIQGTGGDRLIARQELAASVRWNRESTVSLGWAQQDGHAPLLSAGLEVQFFNVFAIRTGLSNLAPVYEAQHSPNDLQFSGGFGVFHKGYYVDAAVGSNHDLGASYRMSLRFPLGHGGRP